MPFVGWKFPQPSSLLHRLYNRRLPDLEVTTNTTITIRTVQDLETPAVMPREPRKIDSDEMALYQARYCDEYEETGTKLVVYPEDKAVKPIDKSTVHEDNWPMFVLKDTMPVGEGGKIVNILLAVRDEPNFKVTGRVIVDNDMKARRKQSNRFQCKQTPDIRSMHLPGQVIQEFERRFHPVEEA
jgi:hypothetical protein